MTNMDQAESASGRSEIFIQGKIKRCIDCFFIGLLFIYLVTLPMLFPPVNLLSASLFIYCSIFILLVIYSPRLWLWAAIVSICMLGFVPNLFGIFNKVFIDGSIFSISMIEQIRVSGIKGQVISLPILGLPPSLLLWWIKEEQICLPKSYMVIVAFCALMILSSSIVCLRYMDISLFPPDINFIIPELLKKTHLAKQWWQSGMPYTLIAFTLTFTFANIIGVLLFAAVFNIINDRKDIGLAFSALTLSTILSISYGYAQTKGLVPAFTLGGSLEATFQSQGSYGIFVGISCVFFFNRIFFFKRRVIMNFVFFVVAVLGIFINQTRTALFALIINAFLVYVTYMVFKYKGIEVMTSARKWILVTIMVLIGASFVLLNTSRVGGYIYKNGNHFIRQVVDTVDLDKSYGAIRHSRLDLWGKCIEIWKEKPVFGCGQGQLYWELKMRGEPDTAANQYILILAELGIVGICLFLLIIICAGKDLTRNLFNKEAEPDYAYWLVCTSMVICILVQSFTVHTFHFPNLPLLIWIIVAMALASSRIRDCHG